MKRILIEISLLFLGGSEKQFRYIISYLNHCEDCELHVLVENKSLVNDLSLVNAFLRNNNNVRFHFLNSNAIKYNHSNQLIRYSTKLWSLFVLYLWHFFNLPFLRIDTAMINNMTGLMMVPVLRLFNCETIYNERNTGRQVCNNKISKAILCSCDRIVANSLEATRYLEKELNRIVKVINNGIDSHSVKIDKEEKKENSCFNILIPARINPIKNQRYVLETLEEIKGLNYRVTMAGAIEDSRYKHEIDEFIRTHHMEKNVFIKGFVENMLLEYKMADLVILPSLEEGTPNVVLEAFSAGIPVIASRIPQNSACIQNEKFLFSLSNRHELKRLILLFSEHGEHINIEECIKNNREYLEKNYSLKEMQTNYYNLLVKGEKS